MPSATPSLTRSLLDRLRTRRLASSFAALIAVSLAIVIGSYTAHGVHGQDKQDNSSDATPLKIPNSTVPPSQFAQLKWEQAKTAAASGANTWRAHPNAKVRLTRRPASSA